MRTALNQATVPEMAFEAFLDLASSLGCVGVELRDDIGRPLFDGITPTEAGRIVHAKGLRILGLSKVHPFNVWSEQVEAKVRDLISLATASGAESISLIPRKDGLGRANGERQGNLRIALKEIRPMLEDAGIVALVTPLGFFEASLRSKAELVGVIEDLDAGESFRVVHDTFHHALAGYPEIFPEHTGIVHMSGVSEPSVAMTDMRDMHRGLIDEHDRLESIRQISELINAGYEGPVSYECFAPETRAMTDPFDEIERSLNFIDSQIQARAA